MVSEGYKRACGPRRTTGARRRSPERARGKRIEFMACSLWKGDRAIWNEAKAGLLEATVLMMSSATS